ncbi:hypothetical protein G7Y79_00031g065720 [Physcia stellaris]|nr:hypothetical protein G7Y79_00031g065720 [Physcia stellaris]
MLEEALSPGRLEVAVVTMSQELVRSVKQWYASAAKSLRLWYSKQRPSSNPEHTPDADTWTTHESNLALFECLSRPIGKRPALPPELIFLIRAEPTRWVLQAIESFPLKTPRPMFGSQARVTRQQGSDQEPILTMRQLSRQELRSLVGATITFRSMDQGWSSYRRFHGTYHQSYTWMEVGLIRKGSDFPDQPRWELQRNRHAGREAEEYTVELDQSHGMFESLEEKDEIAIWARAMYPGWQNCVYNANIDLCFAGPDRLDPNLEAL